MAILSQFYWQFNFTPVCKRLSDFHSRLGVCRISGLQTGSQLKIFAYHPAYPINLIMFIHMFRYSSSFIGHELVILFSKITVCVCLQIIYQPSTSLTSWLIDAVVLKNMSVIISLKGKILHFSAPIRALAFITCRCHS